MQASKVANFAFTADYDPPSILVVMRMRRMILKVALNSLKIGYV